MISLEPGFARAGATGRTSARKEIRRPVRPLRLALPTAARSSALLLAISLALSGTLIASAADAQEAPIAPPPETGSPNSNEPAPASPEDPTSVSVEESVGVEADALVGESSRVALAQFTSGIEEREPIDQVSFIGTEVDKIYFFTDLRDMTGTVVTHKWIHDGSVMAEVDFAVRGPRWRVWSSKELDPNLLGDWTVEVVTSDGEVLASETLTLNATNG